MATAQGIVINSTKNKSSIQVLQESCSACHLGCVRIRPDILEVADVFEVGTKVRINVSTLTLCWGTFLTMGFPLIAALCILIVTNSFFITLLGVVLGALAGVMILRRKSPGMSSNISVEAVT